MSVCGSWKYLESIGNVNFFNYRVDKKENWEYLESIGNENFFIKFLNGLVVTDL